MPQQRQTVKVGPATYKATLRDLGHAWENDWPQWNYRHVRTARIQWVFVLLMGAQSVNL